MTRKIVIRKAVIDDIFGIENLGVLLKKEFLFPTPEINRPYAFTQLIRFIANNAAWVAESDGKIVGHVMIEPVGFWWVPNPHYIQTVEFMVHPDFRDGGTAGKLLEKVKKVADEAGLPLLVVVTSGNKAQIIDRFVQGAGLTYQGGNLLYTPLPQQ